MKDTPYAIASFLNAICLVSPGIMEFCIKELAAGYSVDEIKCHIEDGIKASGRT